jgi:hypothetical protein
MFPQKTRSPPPSSNASTAHRPRLAAADVEDTPFDATDAQLAGIRGLIDLSLRVDGVIYDAHRGSLRRLRGVLFVDRDDDASTTASRSLVEHGPSLSRALCIGADDSLRATDVTPNVEHHAAVVHFVRVHGADEIADDHVELTVSTPEHFLGAGVVMSMEASWPRQVDDPPSSGVTEAEAVGAARAALGAPRETPATATRRHQCVPTVRGDACKLVWTVRVDRPLRPGDYDNAGYVNVVGPVPHTSGWVDIRVPRLEVVTTSGSSTWVTQTDEDSYDTNSAPSGAATTIALTTWGWSVTSMRHSSEAAWWNCAGVTLEPLALSFIGYSSETTTSTPGTAARSIPRVNWSAYNHMHHIVDTLADHASEAEFPSLIWWTANSDDAGNSEFGFGASTIMCNASTGVYSIGMSADARPENQDRARHTAGHEIIHTIQFCPEQVGAGGAVTPGAAAIAGSPFFEGAATAIGRFFNPYETPHLLSEGVPSRQVFGGAGVAGDVLVDEADLEGTPSGAGRCTATGPRTASEACYPSAPRSDVGSLRNRLRTRSFTQGLDNFHEVFAQFGPRYEVTRVFHRTSTESFPWLEDASDHRLTVEAVQTPRTTALNFSSSSTEALGSAASHHGVGRGPRLVPAAGRPEPDL